MQVVIHKNGLLLYLAVLASAVVFASFFGGPAAYAWLYAVLLLVPLSAVYISLNHLTLNIFQEIEVHRVVKGEDHRFRAVIENAGPLPIHRMKLHLYDERCRIYEIREGQEISLNSWEKKELVSGISCSFAGSYDVGLEKVSFTDPFSIFTVYHKIPYNFRAAVNPPVTDIASASLDLENLMNSTGRRSNFLREDTAGSDMRPYQRGDSLRTVNWKVSARLGEPVVRVPDRREIRTVTILMLSAAHSDREQDLGMIRRRDYFLDFIVSAAWHFAERGLPVRLIYPGGRICEVTLDSYRSFMDFYTIAADGIFYSSHEEYRKLRQMAAERKGGVNDDGTWILIMEEPEAGEDFFCICE